MNAIDSNVLLRLLIRDDPKQVKQAESFIQKGAWVSSLVLAETIWVLESAYSLESKQISLSIYMLLNHAQLILQDADVVENALTGYQANSKPSFTDYLILELIKKVICLWVPLIKL